MGTGFISQSFLEIVSSYRSYLLPGARTQQFQLRLRTRLCLMSRPMLRRYWWPTRARANRTMLSGCYLCPQARHARWRSRGITPRGYLNGSLLFARGFDLFHAERDGKNARKLLTA